LYYQFGKYQSLQEYTIYHAEPELQLKKRVLGILDKNARMPGLKKKRSTFGCIIYNVSIYKEGRKDGDCFKKYCNIAEYRVVVKKALFSGESVFILSPTLIKTLVPTLKKICKQSILAGSHMSQIGYFFRSCRRWYLPLRQSTE
jgi:hypothetical protein